MSATSRTAPLLTATLFVPFRCITPATAADPPGETVRITGTVTDADGGPVAAAVTAVAGGEAVAEAGAGADGRFTLRDVPPGRTYLFADVPDDGPPGGAAGGNAARHRVRGRHRRAAGGRGGGRDGRAGRRGGRVAADRAGVRAGPAPPADTADDPDDPLPVGSVPPPLRGSAAFTPNGTPAESPPDLGDLRGRWVLLDFRATWCGPCRRDDPAVHLAAELYGDRLTVVEVYDNSSPTPEVAAYLADRPAAGPVLRDTDDAATVNAYAVAGYPTYVLLGPDGRVRLTGRHDRDALRPRLVDTLRRFLAAEQNP